MNFHTKPPTALHNDTLQFITVWDVNTSYLNAYRYYMDGSVTTKAELQCDSNGVTTNLH